jgi:hypothetical protein
MSLIAELKVELDPKPQDVKEDFDDFGDIIYF